MGIRCLTVTCFSQYGMSVKCLIFFSYSFLSLVKIHLFDFLTFHLFLGMQRNWIREKENRSEKMREEKVDYKLLLYDFIDLQIIYKWRWTAVVWAYFLNSMKNVCFYQLWCCLLRSTKKTHTHRKHRKQYEWLTLDSKRSRMLAILFFFLQNLAVIHIKESFSI